MMNYSKDFELKSVGLKIGILKNIKYLLSFIVPIVIIVIFMIVFSWFSLGSVLFIIILLGLIYFYIIKPIYVFYFPRELKCKNDILYLECYGNRRIEIPIGEIYNLTRRIGSVRRNAIRWQEVYDVEFGGTKASIYLRHLVKKQDLNDLLERITNDLNSNNLKYVKDNIKMPAQQKIFYANGNTVFDFENKVIKRRTKKWPFSDLQRLEFKMKHSIYRPYSFYKMKDNTIYHIEIKCLPILVENNLEIFYILKKYFNIPLVVELKMPITYFASPDRPLKASPNYINT